MTFQALLSRPCTLVRRSDSATRDRFGNAIYDLVQTDTVCELQQRRRTEPGTLNEVSITEWDLFLPVDTAIDTGDAVIVDDATYEVVGDPWQADSGSGAVHHVEATVRRTHGDEGAS